MNLISKHARAYSEKPTNKRWDAFFQDARFIESRLNEALALLRETRPADADRLDQPPNGSN